MIPDGYLPPLRNTEDIPIHRPSVGGMGLNTTEPEFKPYVYRGWDVDLFADLLPVTRPAPPAPAEKPPARRSRPRRRPVAPRPDPDLAVAETAAREARRLLAELDKPEPEVKRKKVKHKKPKKHKPAIPPLPPRQRLPARPAAGWKPMVGADLEDAWALLEEDI